MSSLKLETHENLVNGMLDVLFTDHDGKHLNPFDVQNKTTANTIVNYLFNEIQDCTKFVRRTLREANTAKTKKWQHSMTMEYFKMRLHLLKTLHTTLVEYYSKKGFMDFGIEIEPINNI